jgi:hypothetical protein
MKYYTQNIAGSFLRNLSDECGAMEIHPRHLRGLDAGEFHDGFRALTQLMRKLYTDIMNDPGTFGMPLIEITDQKSDSADYTKSYDGFKRVPHTLLILGAAGQLGADLTISAAGKDLIAAAKAVKLTKLTDMLVKLGEYGFEIGGFSKAVKEGDELTVGYPDCRPLTAALKSMAEAQRDIGQSDLRRNNYCFYMMMPEILRAETAKEPVLGVENMCRALNAGNQETARLFDGCVRGRTKAKYREPYLMRNDWSATYTGTKTKQVILSLRTEQDDLAVKLNLEHIGEYMDAVMALPDALREKIRKNGWTCNQSDCNPKCAGGFAFEMDGVAYNPCRGAAFRFSNVSPDEAAHLKTLLELELKREA